MKFEKKTAGAVFKKIIFITTFSEKGRPILNFEVKKWKKPRQKIFYLLNTVLTNEKFNPNMYKQYLRNGYTNRTEIFNSASSTMVPW